MRPIGSPTSVDFLFLEEISGDDLRTTFATSFVTVGTLFLFCVDAHARRAYASPCACPAAAKTKWRMRRRRHSRVFGTEFETPVRRARDRLRFLHRVCAPHRPVASSVLLQPNVSNGLLDIAEDLEVPEACGWLLIGTDPMGILVDADGFFGHTRLTSIPELKEAICVRLPRDRAFAAHVRAPGQRAHRAGRCARGRSRARAAMPVPVGVCSRARAARAAPLEYRWVSVRVVRESGRLCMRHHRAACAPVGGGAPIPSRPRAAVSVPVGVCPRARV